MDVSNLYYLIREPQAKSGTRKAVILLHGVGSNERDLFGLADQLPPDFFVLSVRAPFTLGPGRFAWYNVDFSTGKPVFDAAQESFSRETLRSFVTEVKSKYQLDEIYLGGFSQGAIMSYSVGLANPKDIGGIIALSGRVLEQVRTSTPASPDFVKQRVFLAHGLKDDKLPIHYAREAKEFLARLKVNLTYTEYEMGHEINTSVLSDLSRWLRSGKAIL